MNPQIVVDFLAPKLNKLGWRDVRLADSIEPDTEIEDVPVALLIRGSNRPRGENRTDNCISQVVKEFFGIQVAARRDELEQRLDELSGALLGAQLPGFDFLVQYHEGMPLLIGRDTEWFLETYFTERERQNYA